MSMIPAPRAAVLAALGLSFSIFMVSAQAAMFATFTFHRDDPATVLSEDPHIETVNDVTLTVSSDDHVHLGDWSGDGDPNLYNHGNIIQTLAFSQPVTILDFDVVAGNSTGFTGNSFVSSAGGTFTVGADTIPFLFDVTTNGNGVWAEITSFDWTQDSGGDLTIDNLRISFVPVPVAFWLGLSGLVALSRFKYTRT